MFKTLINNLSKTQKICLLVALQIIVIVILASLVQSFTAEKSHVEIENNAEISAEIPDNAERFIKDNIWQLIKDKVADVDKNNIDVVIREGTYNEIYTDDGVQATFIVDIDSLKQSYRVSTGWSEDGSTVYEVIVNCPRADEMKYPETICYGAYNDSYSLDLYLPYSIYPEEGDEEEVVAPDVYINGDEDRKIIDVMVSKCDVDSFKKKATDYLKTLPIDLNDYTINYEINDINVRC